MLQSLKLYSLSNIESVNQGYDVRITTILFMTATGCAPTVQHQADDPNNPCDQISGQADFYVSDDGEAWLDWEGGEAWALAVTSPGAKIGAWGRVTQGAMYWQVAASDWNDMLQSPVRYGATPDNASNYTSFGGGVFEELQPGRCYEVHMSNRAHGEFSRMQFRLP